MSNKRAFTLIELLVVVSMIVMIMGVTLPSLAEARRSSKKTKCQHNLRQISEAVSAYLLTHHDVFPYIARFPSYEGDLADTQNRNPYPPIYTAYKNETGGMDEVFECPADKNTKTPEVPTHSYFEHEGTSYEWETELNGLRLGFKTTLLFSELLRGRAEQLPMVYDFEPFHGGDMRVGSHNVLYADLSVRSDKWKRSAADIGRQSLVDPSVLNTIGH